ncbi:hypothetical protein AX15_001887 [Amanita polypyramis BW_CC]|nr:hypothetical protein AX15_001887 [Amanita polypyramis BW_CC]
MASPFTMLGILGKSRRAHTVSQRVNATGRPSQDDQRAARKSDETDSRLNSPPSSSSSRILDDKAVLVEEPTYTVIPKSDQKADLDQEWTDLDIEGIEKTRVSKAEEERVAREAQAREEERKRKEAEEKEKEERRKREEDRLAEEGRRLAGEERRLIKEQRRIAEEELRLEREERRLADEKRKIENEDRKNEEERRSRDEERRKREETERRMRENHDAAARIREDRAREEERSRQEKLRAQERDKLEEHIRQQDEKERLLQAKLAASENDQQASTIQIREFIQGTELLEDQNNFLKDQLKRQTDEMKALKSQAYDSSSNITRFLSIGVAKSSKSIEQELVTLLDILNSEVYQAAACLADLLESRSQPSIKATGRAAEEVRVTKMLGKGMTEVLRSKASLRADFEPLIVQVALQMCMNHCCARIIESWCPGMWNYNDFLSTLFTNIQATEDIGTASKWRAVTHAQFRQNEYTRIAMARYLSEHVITLLSFIGLSESSTSWVTELFEERCPMIVGPALQMNTTIFEDTMGDSLEIFLVRSGDVFDMATMENSYNDGDDDNDSFTGLVVATTDLGLRRLTGGYEDDSCIIKPKVILSSAFDAETRHALEQDH